MDRLFHRGVDTKPDFVTPYFDDNDFDNSVDDDRFILLAGKHNHRVATPGRYRDEEVDMRISVSPEKRDSPQAPPANESTIADGRSPSARRLQTPAGFESA
jgi:hypothetical protein